MRAQLSSFNVLDSRYLIAIEHVQAKGLYFYLADQTADLSFSFE